MNTHSFTAVDFETATSDRMICEIGIVVVKDNKIVKKIPQPCTASGEQI